MLAREMRAVWLYSLKPSQGCVPADLTLASDLAFVFKACRDRLECCIDPLRPPPKPEIDTIPNLGQSCLFHDPFFGVTSRAGANPIIRGPPPRAPGEA